jgi:hypothetical protein
VAIQEKRSGETFLMVRERRTVEPALDVIEFSDGFAIRAAARCALLGFGQFEQIAYLKKADGWTRQTASSVLALAEKIRMAQSRLQTVEDD